MTDRSARLALCTSGRKLKQPPVAGVPVTIAAVWEKTRKFLFHRVVVRLWGAKSQGHWDYDLLKQMKNSSMVAWLFPTSQPP